MNKPKPIDLLIEPDSAPLLPSTIRIEAHTSEAQRWIQENAREFGVLYSEPLQDDTRIKWALWLYRAYDRAQVIEYLLHQWDFGRWPEEVESGVEVESEAK